MMKIRLDDIKKVFQFFIMGYVCTTNENGVIVETSSTERRKVHFHDEDEVSSNNEINFSSHPFFRLSVELMNISE